MSVTVPKANPAPNLRQSTPLPCVLWRGPSLPAKATGAALQSDAKAPFEPKILAILCNWCTYSAADAAGSSHSAYPANIHIVRVMCSGRVDPDLILKALRRGMDGVLICGCHPGDCHYINGNHKTAFRIPMLRRVIAQFGIEPERLRLEWISAAESNRFVEVAKDMTEQIRRLGPVWAPGRE